VFLPIPSKVINDYQRAANQAFKKFERTGWAEQAQHYDSLVGQMTRQAVDALLVNARPGARLLDVASGPATSRLTYVRCDRMGGRVASDWLWHVVVADERSKTVNTELLLVWPGAGRHPDVRASFTRATLCCLACERRHDS